MYLVYRTRWGTWACSPPEDVGPSIAYPRQKNIAAVFRDAKSAEEYLSVRRCLADAGLGILGRGQVAEDRERASRLELEAATVGPLALTYAAHSLA